MTSQGFDNERHRVLGLDNNNLGLNNSDSPRARQQQSKGLTITVLRLDNDGSLKA